MAQKPSDTSSIIYHPPKSRYANMTDTSIVPIGIDTEADRQGRMFVACLSDGTIIRPEEWPARLLDKQHRGATYVAWNLKYDMGALLQHLPEYELDVLRRTDHVSYGGYKYRVIANKMLSINYGKYTCYIYDIMQFYGGSLSANSRRYLNDDKLEGNVTEYTDEYIQEHWDEICRYCIHDASLTQRLAQRLISQLETWGIYTRKLYSTAWMSYQHFASTCGHPSVKHIWQYDRRVLDFAMAAYNGGKFEVTRKGLDYYYEYDLVSAYPSSIANLIDLYHCGIYWGKRIHSDAYYAFIDGIIDIPIELPSPVAVKRRSLNIYPAGRFRKTITKQEYEYITNNGGSVEILSACSIIPDKLQYPYRDEIARIVAIKQSVKGKDQLAYHTSKILMNSLYGKFVQLVEMPDGMWRAGSSWNPIYGSVITAETRVRIADLQRQYPSIVAVHTDSIISTVELPYPKTDELGGLSYEIEGEGIVIASGVYEIGGKTAIRGVPSQVTLRDIAEKGGKKTDVSSMQPRSWRMALLREHDELLINEWTLMLKTLRPDMDMKRVWLDDYTDWSQVLDRRVDSVPYIWSESLFG